MSALRVILAFCIASVSICVSPCWGASITPTVEVTQGIQYADFGTPNSLKLVAERRTIVRTKVVIAGVPKGKIDNVTGLLKITPALAVSTFTPLNSVEHTTFQKSKATFSRRNIDHTLNFQVNGVPAGTYTFTVDVTLTRRGGTALTNSVSATLTAIDLRKIEIHIVPLKFGTTPAPTDIELIDESFHFRNCLPIADHSPIIIHTTPYDIGPDATCSDIVDNVGIPDYTEVDLTLNQLVYMAEATAAESFYYGFLKDDNSIGNLPYPDCPIMFGWGRCKAGFGMAGSSFSGKTFAHEFGHFLGFDHCGACGGSDPCTMNAIPVSVYEGLKAFHSVSYMTCGMPLPPPGWSTPVQWKKAIDILDAAAPPAASCKDDVGDWADPGQEKALVVHGKVRSEGGAVQWLDPMVRVPWVMRPTPVYPGNYSVTAEDPMGNVIATRNFNPVLRLESAVGPPGTTFGLFSIVLPIPNATKVQRVFIREGAVDLRTVEASKDAPTIGQIVTTPPNVLSSTINAAFTLQWTTSDSDTPPADRLHHVVYSRDNGEDFQPVAVNIRSSSATIQANFDPDDYFPSNGANGLLWIVASDGLNTTVETLSGLQVP